LYSVTQKEDANEIIKIIQKYQPDLNQLIITDATAGVGGDTINFALKFKQVNAIEIAKTHCDILQHNIDVYRLKNVIVHCTNYLDIMKKIKQDIIYFDPPWGGIEYKEQKELQLFLKDQTIEDVIKILLNDAKMFVVKVPFNFDLKHFQKKLKKKKIAVHKLKKFNIVVVY
jgi:16S rRNA G966 N2-methylase RsmD